jgi:hypothetical protein
VTVSVAVIPVPFVAVTVFAPGAAAPDVHAYATGEAYGEPVSAPPAELDHPLVEDASGKATWAIPVCGSDAVALRVNDPDPAGRNHIVSVPESQYSSPAPLTSVGALLETVGAVSGVTVKEAVSESTASAIVTSIDPLALELDVKS